MTLNDISIRTELRSGDIGYITYLHGSLYQTEYRYGIAFESYVAAGLHEFYSQFDPELDRAWICEHNQSIIGFLLLMHRTDSVAQLRFYIIRPEYRGIGLGKKLMELFMEFLKIKEYRSCYLWTTSELHQAAALYQRFGFQLKEEKPSCAFGKPVIEQRYEWNF